MRSTTKRLACCALGAVGAIASGLPDIIMAAPFAEASVQSAPTLSEEERFVGLVHRFVIDDQASAASTDVVMLALDGGSALELEGARTGTLRRGMRVEITGRRSGQTLVVQDIKSVSPPVAEPTGSRTPRSVRGTLVIARTDDLVRGRSTLIVQVHATGDTIATLDLPLVPAQLRPGMEIEVRGSESPPSDTLAADVITILSPSAR